MTTIRNCARCGQDHELEFRRFQRPMQRTGYTHWATCPTTGEPIIMVMATDAPATIEEKP